MTFLGIIKPKMLAFVPLILLLVITVACGEEATPQPTATPAPPPPTIDMAAIGTLVEEAVKAGISEVPEAVSAAEIQQMIKAAVAEIPEPPEGVSATDIEQMVQSAVAKAAAAGASPEEIGELVSAAVAAAAAEGITKEDVASAIAKAVGKTLTAQDITTIVKAVLPPTPTPIPAPEPVPTAAFRTSTTDRLIYAATPEGQETVIIWRASYFRPFGRPMIEELVNTDTTTGKFVPRLASAWEMAPNGRDWTVDLQQGVQFHFGWGEFTAKDVVHSLKSWLHPESLGGQVSTVKDLLGATDDLEKVEENIEIVNDYRVVFHLTRPEPDFDFRMSGKEHSLAMMSKAQFDAVGASDAANEALIDAAPGVTGPYRFLSRELGVNVLYERVEDHWRKTPEFKELLVSFAPEHSTRLAMMLTGEAHLVELPRLLQEDAIRKGKKKVRASVPGTGLVYFFNGVWFSTPEHLDDDNPFLKKDVREAMNRAINREEIADEIFKGDAIPWPLAYYHPSVVGWDQSWLDRFDEAYGYDPVKAKALLAGAGYPEGFKTKIFRYPWSGTPEMDDVTDALVVYFTAIGIDVKVEQTEWLAVRAQRIYEPGFANTISHFPPFSLRPPHGGIGIVHNPKSNNHHYEHPLIDEKMDELAQTVDLDTRDQLQRDIGEHLFTEYATMNIVSVPASVIIDPDVIGEYILPGTYAGHVTHLEYIKAAQVE